MKNITPVIFAAVIALASCKKDPIITKPTDTVKEDTIYKKTLPNHSQLRITPTTHFVDDWQGETVYLRVTLKNGKATTTKMEKAAKARSFHLAYKNELMSGAIVQYELIDEKDVVQYSERLYFIPQGKVIVQDPTITKVVNQDKWTHTNGLTFANNLQINIEKDSLKEIDKVMIVLDSIRVYQESKGGTVIVKKEVTPVAMDNPIFVSGVGVLTNTLNSFRVILEKENLAKDQKITGTLLLYLKDLGKPHGTPMKFDISL